jgi:signal transduction histidine kinase
VAVGLSAEDAVAQCHWLVRLRWIAILGIAFVATVSWWLGLLDTALPILGVIVFMALSNLALELTAARAAACLPWACRLFMAHLGIDLVALTVLLHFAGGIENPFALCYVFPVMIGALVCPGRTGYVLAGLAFALYAAMALLEWGGWLHHYPVRVIPYSPGLWQSAPYLVGALLVMGATLAVVTVLSSATMQRLRRSLEAERALRQRLGQQERLALIGEVVAGVVHELGTPLNGVRNSFRALRRNPEGFLKRADILQLMDEALDRMAFISRRVLTLTRDPRIEKQPIDVNEIVERTLAELQHRMDAVGVSLERRLAPGLPAISADGVAVGEVITNLVNNALDAVEAGGRVMVETSNSHGSVEIRVIDSGPGIPEAARARLFEPFHSTKPVGKGTGLGLAISKRLVEAHGGGIAVDSRAEEGTTVTVRLPAGE